jgi:transcriptional regulator with XRE-family HTH domain
MEFGENLKQYRKMKNYSQEELAELLDVSRQAVSKWEQGTGYPETEKLILLSRVLDCSLDDLLDTGFAGKNRQTVTEIQEKLLITSPHENIVISCSNVCASGKLSWGKNAPQYALFREGEDHPYWGKANTFLAWYADEEGIKKEVQDIRQAFVSGMSHYTLQYSVKTERRWLSLKIQRK